MVCVVAQRIIIACLQWIAKPSEERKVHVKVTLSIDWMLSGIYEPASRHLKRIESVVLKTM